jgi:alkanesulfonate monooxygenase SsuD/methylene tetrahydromethanopterin reductase-like flavin-dependent oxidoreductase (luciferase family)
VYIGGLVPSQASYQIEAARNIARNAGRDPYTIKFFAAINPIIGRTAEEAHAKYEEAMQHADVIGALAQFSGYTGIYMSKYPLDEELKLDTSNPKESAVQGFLGNFGDSQKDGIAWTPRKLGEKIAVGGFHPTPVGTAQMVADEIEKVR